MQIYCIASLEDARRRGPSKNWTLLRDHNGQALAYVYFEDEPGRHSAVVAVWLTSNAPSNRLDGNSTYSRRGRGVAHTAAVRRECMYCDLHLTIASERNGAVSTIPPVCKVLQMICPSLDRLGQ